MGTDGRTCKRDGCDEGAMSWAVNRTGLCRAHWAEHAAQVRPPIRVPGKPSVAVMRQTPTLSIVAFNDGWEVLSGYYRMPKDGQPKDLYYEALRYELTDDEWRRSIRHHVRVQESSRCPSPQKVIDAVAGLRQNRLAGTGGEAEPHAGCWIYVCQGCGYRVLMDHPTEEPDEYCGKCADTRREPEPERVEEQEYVF